MGKKSKDILIGRNFLLQSEAAEELYHEYAKDLPIIDYHCHLSPELIARDHRFPNMTQCWLAGDHYKWRAMRAAGVDEALITGAASDWDKFQAWAQTVPRCLRNPIYHWTHLELKRPFGISDRLLNPATAPGIWERCNELLATPAFSTRGIMMAMRVQVVCTTDDPVDSLEHHRALARDRTFPVKVLPTWRPDRASAVEDPVVYNAWVDRLCAASNRDITDYQSLQDALQARHDVFHAHGCRLSDHGVETIPVEACTAAQAAAIFAKVRAGQAPTEEEAVRFRSVMLHEGALMDHAAGWAQQFHIGPLRNTNSRQFAVLGPDAGYDTMGDASLAKPLARFLDRLDATRQLTRTILYNINPRDNATLATMIGNFQEGPLPGKIQFGSSWWFLDQKDGIEGQLDALSNMGLLSTFVGMLTDSRSFLSYTRHEYFRRILCNLLGAEIEDGLLPRDIPMIGELVHGICYGNAVRYFDGFAGSATAAAEDPSAGAAASGARKRRSQARP